MGVIRHRRTPLYKPEPLEVNPNAPFASQLVFCVVFNGSPFAPDLVSGNIPTFTSTGGAIETPEKKLAITKNSDRDLDGRLYNDPGSNVSRLDYGRTGLDELTSSGGLAAFMRGGPGVGATSKYGFYSGENALGNGFGLTWDDIALVTNGFFMHSNNNNRTNSGSNVLRTPLESYYHDIGCIIPPGGNCQLYAYGASVGTATSAPVTSHTNRKSYINGFRDFNGQDTATQYLYAYSGDVDPDLAKTIHENPWQVVREKRTFVPIAVAAGGAGNLLDLEASYYGNGGFGP